MNRRDFVRASGAAAALAPTIVPSSIFGQEEKASPSERITVGLIGCGGQGSGDMNAIMHQPDTQIVAVCDVDKAFKGRGLEPTKGKVEKYYGENKPSGNYKGCDTYTDFRELCARDDIDTVIVGTPDHWHALATLEALRNGKDVYCEKPITHLFAEGQAVYKEAAKRKAIFQVGSQQRSDTRFRMAAEVVLNGLIGKVTTVKVGLPTGNQTDHLGKRGEAIPEGLDYDLWCGPSRYLPFHPDRLHWNWRWCLDYGGGQLMDWIGHHNDIAHWGLDKDKSGPIKVEASEFRFPEKGMYDGPIDYAIKCDYAEGYTLTISNRHKMGKDGRSMGTLWEGTDGWVYVDRGRIEATNKDWIREVNDRGPIKAYKSRSHHRNFVDGCKTRKECICPAETGHRSATPGHLGYASLALGRPIKWDPEKEVVIDDPKADKFLKTVNYRGDWKLEA